MMQSVLHARLVQVERLLNSVTLKPPSVSVTSPAALRPISPKPKFRL
jgi:hypothetical protein